MEGIGEVDQESIRSELKPELFLHPWTNLTDPMSSTENQTCSVEGNVENQSAGTYRGSESNNVNFNHHFVPPLVPQTNLISPYGYDFTFTAPVRATNSAAPVQNEPADNYDPELDIWWNAATSASNGAAFNRRIGWHFVVLRGWKQKSRYITPPHDAPCFSAAIDGSSTTVDPCLSQMGSPIQPEQFKDSALSTLVTAHNSPLNITKNVTSPTREQSEENRRSPSPAQICVCGPDKSKNIPRPCNSFILYRGDNQPRYKKQLAQKLGKGKKVNQQQVSALIGKAWRNEHPKVKEKYRQLAEKEKEEHRRKHPEYRYKPNSKQKQRFGLPNCTCGAREANMGHSARHEALKETDIASSNPSSYANDADNGSHLDLAENDTNGLQASTGNGKRKANSYKSSPQSWKRTKYTTSAPLDHAEFSGPGQYDPNLFNMPSYDGSREPIPAVEIQAFFNDMNAIAEAMAYPGPAAQQQQELLPAPRSKFAVPEAASNSAAVEPVPIVAEASGAVQDTYPDNLFGFDTSYGLDQFEKERAELSNPETMYWAWPSNT